MLLTSLKRDVHVRAAVDIILGNMSLVVPTRPGII